MLKKILCILQPQKQHNLRQNLKYLRAINVLYGTTFFMPYLALYLQTHLFSLSNVALIFSVQTIVAIIFELPSGLLSDKLGRKKTLVLSSVLRICAFVLLLFAVNMIGFICYAILSAIAGSLRSGTDVSLIYETCHELEDDASFQKQIGDYYSLYPIGATISAAIAGVVSKVSLEFTIWLSFIPAALIILLSMNLIEPHYHRYAKHKSFMTQLLDYKKHLFSSKFVYHIILASALIASFFALTESFTSIFFEYKGVDISTIGYFIAMFYLLNTYGYRISYYFSKLVGQRHSLHLSIIGLSASVFLSTLTSSYISVLCFLFAGFFYAINTPIITDMLNSNIESTHRAMLNSTTTFCTSINVFIVTTLVFFSNNYLNINTIFMLLCIIPLLSIVTLGLNRKA